MVRPVLELADILREHGPAWREANRGHVSLDQLKVMSAIERCRTAALGGHVARCENPACGVTLHEILRLGRFFAFAAGNSETRTDSSLEFAANVRMPDERRRAV